MLVIVKLMRKFINEPKIYFALFKSYYLLNIMSLMIDFCFVRKSPGNSKFIVRKKIFSP